MVDELLSLDLSEHPNTLQIKLMMAYDAKIGLMDYGKQSVDKFLYTTAHHHDNEFSFIGGLKEHLYRQYFMLDIRRNYGMELLDWLKQDLADINMQINLLPKLIDEKQKIMDELEKKRKEAEGKK